MPATAENTITVTGNLADDPELRFTPNGVAVTNVRVAVNKRKFNRDTNDWDDELDGFFTCNVWRDQAENVAESLVKGTRVVVVGRLRNRQWEDKEGNTRWSTEIEADEVCPSLKWASASLTRKSGNSGGGQRQSSGGGWGSAPAVEAEDVPF